jgi:antibiotic biosynthesis monooxygenase (ABM) superfamily enzyme
LALFGQQARKVAARAVAPILLFALVLVIVSIYRAIFGLESEASPAGWQRVTVLICISLCVVALMAAAAIPIARWLAL